MLKFKYPELIIMMTFISTPIVYATEPSSTESRTNEIGKMNTASINHNLAVGKRLLELVKFVTLEYFGV